MIMHKSNKILTRLRPHYSHLELQDSRKPCCYRIVISVHRCMFVATYKGRSGYRVQEDKRG